MLSVVMSAFIAAQSARRPYQDRWERYYRIYRSWVQRGKSDWHSKVFIPIAFWIIESITPHLVANLPKFLALPVGPEDVPGSKLMETAMDWAVSNSNLYVELVKGTKSSLRYGTGIYKVYQRQDIRRARKLVPAPPTPLTAKRQVPTIDPETGTQAVDTNGEPLWETQEVEVGQTPGQGMIWQPYTYSAYDGPAAEAIDIFNFWPAPEADSIETSRYVIHRTYRDLRYVKDRVSEGVFVQPFNMTLEEIGDISEEPNLRRLSQIGLGSMSNDPTRKPVELLEYWDDEGRVITVANRKAILRAHENPFDHGQKPFVRQVDFLAEHEFWGIGEIEPLEGQQDLINALTNQRVDNIRLVLNAMFAVNTREIEDLGDLKSRPGGVVRVRGDMPPREAIERIDFGDVTSSAFQEAQMQMDYVERASAVNAYTMGQDSPSLNDTATGVSLLQEAGTGRFSLKTRLAELMALRPLARMYGGLLLQFTTEPKTLRILGPQGEQLFMTMTPESLQGNYDYDIEVSSLVQTESRRRADATTLFQLLLPTPVTQWALPAMVQDLLNAYGRKNVQDYMPPPMPPGLPPGMPAPPAGMMGGQGPGPGAPPSPGAGTPPGTPPGFQVPQPGPLVGAANGR
jgi:hypothetical protein